MTELQVFKTRITNACAFIKAKEPEINRLDHPFTFPNDRGECECFIKEQTATLNHLQRSLKNAKELLDGQINAALQSISARTEQKEREKLMLNLNKYLKQEANSLDFTILQWMNKIDYRREELAQQKELMPSSNTSTSNVSNSDYPNHVHTPTQRMERQLQIRKPVLEIPTSRRNFREFNAFWSIFESLAHNDMDLTDTEKFLFLRQALKGKAATIVSSLPVTGEKYVIAVPILKKHFDKSANMADILINEIERLPRAKEDPRNCRETFEAITSRLSHLEQTGIPMNADRVWRRIILSKFPEFICRKVIQKENEAGSSFDVTDIANAVDDIITLQETTSLTTKTLFQPEQNESLARRYGKPQRIFAEKPRGEHAYVVKNIHLTNCGPCPKCKEDHHSALCIPKRSQSETTNLAPSRPWQPSGRNTHNAVSRPSNYDTQERQQQPFRRSEREVTTAQQNSSPTLDVSLDTMPLKSKQYVLQIISAQIFNEAEQEYQPITILLDSGAQRSFIKSDISDTLKLPVVSSTSFTTTGMGELKETFTSKNVQVTLKSMNSSRKLQRLSIHTKEKLTSTTKTAQLSDEDRSFIKNRKISIAQSGLESAPVKPGLLIGQDLLDNIIDHDSSTVKLPSELILTPTIFGYTISVFFGTLFFNLCCYGVVAS
ncbi:Tas retrotransposon peptidase A16 [Oesophagostomum dentatum]|uniref:Tas retrotransposon peptidase A16 n=1 Tax=Oesophagostomum dentatum TaxID=61180 RepID=A0A0B1TNG5_OESDE|nr:Tas retrotransposon peptidase A16 [Oesophagostomum dentatum]